MRASPTNCWTDSTVHNPGRSTLTATGHARATSRARCTVPMPPLPSWRNSSYSGAKAARRRSKKVDTVPEPQNIPATVLKVKRPRAYRGRFTAALASRRLLHRDRDVHAKGDVRQAIALVDAGRCPGKRHIVLFIRLRQERPHEVAHRVGHPLFQGGRTVLRDRIGVEGDVVGTARHVDEPYRCAGFDADLVGLERGYAGTVAGHLHFDHRASGLGGRHSGRRGCGSLGLRRRRLLVAAARSRRRLRPRLPHPRDRKSTRLNSSHRTISYAVFCLKKKKK